MVRIITFCLLFSDYTYICLQNGTTPFHSVKPFSGGIGFLSTMHEIGHFFTTGGAVLHVARAIL